MVQQFIIQKDRFQSEKYYKMTDIELKKSALDLIYLARCAVYEVMPDAERCAHMDTDKLAAVAGFHAMRSIVGNALSEIVELPKVFDHAMKKNIRKLALYDIDRSKILRAFDERGIRYLPLKGIIISSLYPKRAMREMADNDILCDNTRMAEVREIMEGFGYTCDAFSAEISHDVYTKSPALEFEMHRALFVKEDSAVLSAYYSDITDRLVKDDDDTCGYHMTAEDMYIYMLCHMYKHYSHAGTGLRSLLDIYLYVRRYYDSLDKDYLTAQLKILSLISFESMIRQLAVKTFTEEPLSDTESNILDYLIYSGCNGTADHAFKNRVYNALNDDKTAGSKRRFVFKRLFISDDELKEKYPVVYKHRALYPLLTLYRPIKGIITHPKLIAKETKLIKKHKKDS